MKTRINAIRCETLRTGSTINYKNTFDILPQCIINGSWKMSILIYHNVANKFLKWAPQLAHLSQKWPRTFFSTSNELVTFFSSFWPHFIHGAVKLSILIWHIINFFLKFLNKFPNRFNKLNKWALKCESIDHVNRFWSLSDPPPLVGTKSQVWQRKNF